MKATASIQAHDQSADTLVLSADGTLLLSGADHDPRQRVKILDAVTLEEKAAMWTPDMHGVKCAAFSADGTLALTGHGSWGGVKLWDVERGEHVRDLVDGMYVLAVAFAGKQALVSFGGSKLQKVNLEIAAPARDSDESSGHDAAFGPDPAFWVNVPNTGECNRPVLRKGSKKVAVLEGHAEQISSLALSSTHLVSGDCDGLAILWSLEGERVRDLYRGDGFERSPAGACFSRDGSRVALGCQDGWVRVFDVASGDEVCAWQPEDHMCVRAVALSPDGGRLYCGTYRGNVLSYELGAASSRTTAITGK